MTRFNDAEVARLAKIYGKAEKGILIQVNKALLKGNDPQALQAMLKNVQHIRAGLLNGAKDWVTQEVSHFYQEGVAVADDAFGAMAIGAVHQEAMKILADNTFQRLEKVDQVIGRRVDDIYRTVSLENITGNIAGYEGWRQTAKNLRADLADRGITGFTDRAGREWNMETYSEMVARTSTREAMNTGTKNRLLEHGHDLAKISSNESDKTCDACAEWAGQVVSLTGETDGYSTLDEAEEDGLFHPNCVHTLGPAVEEELAQKEADQEVSAEGG